MKTTVYIDVLVITNVIINYFILKIISCIANITANSKRLIISSIVGSLFSFTIFLDINNVTALLIKILSVIISAVIAFGFVNKIYFLKTIICTITVYFLFTGTVLFVFQNNRVVYSNNYNLYLNINPMLLVIYIVIIYIIIYLYELIFYSQSKNLIYEIEVVINNKSLKGNALYDTGFRIKDILTNRQLILCDYDFISNILDDGIKEHLNLFYLNGTISDKRIKTVFYSDISKEGILPAIIPDKLIYKDKEIKNSLLVITQSKIEGEINFLIGKEIFNIIKE